MFLGKNIRFLRKEKGLTQSDISDELGIKRTMISAYEDGRSEPKLTGLTKLAEIFHVTVDELLFRDLEKEGRRAVSRQDMKVLAIVVDQQDRENITMVGQKASAGYLNGFSDPEYVGKLPQFHLPNLSQNATYRAFEIQGDSMLPLASGTVIIGAYVDQLVDIRNGKTYVLVTATEGVVYKRVFNYLKEKGQLLLSSDNDRYTPYNIAASDVLEIWEAKAFISTDFPHGKDKNEPPTLEDLSKMILDLRTEIRQLKK